MTAPQLLGVQIKSQFNYNISPLRAGKSSFTLECVARYFRDGWIAWRFIGASILI
jgi:hypothetical protein